MPSPPPQGANSLLNLLNPYASVAQSSYPRTRDADEPLVDVPPDSPSAVLLRELQHNSGGAGGDERPRSPALSPTPTPRRPVHVIATPSSSEDEGPPRSLVFGEARDKGKTARRSGSGGRTPRSRGPDGQRVLAPPTRPWDAAPSHSPGPFRRRPSSASSSTRSRQSSAQRQPESADDSLATPSTESPSLSGAPTISSSTSGDEAPRSSRTPPPRRVSPPLRSPVKPPEAEAQGYAVPLGARKTKGRGQHKYHEVSTAEDGGRRSSDGPSVKKAGLSNYNKALWGWVNVVNLDVFLQEVYGYYKGKGFWAILLARVLNLMTTGFVISFAAFLFTCIEWRRLFGWTPHNGEVGRLDDVLVDHCLRNAPFANVVLIILMSSFWLFQLVSLVLSVPRLVELWRFYTYLLGVPDADIQTLPWPEIVRLIGLIKEDNPLQSLSNGQANALADMAVDTPPSVNAVLDAHDIANRILRKENYLIALFNKDVLDLRFRLPLPNAIVDWIPPSFVIGPAYSGIPMTTSGEGPRFFTFGGSSLTKALEWNLRYCLMGFLFDTAGHVKADVVRGKDKKQLIQQLKVRLYFMGLLNFVFAPFIVLYLLVYSFFRYFEEYRNNPSSIGGRQYTPYAEWKFREFNELPHLFERRVDQSYVFAKEYIDQFPKERTALIMRFVAFVAGSFAAVLLFCSLLDPDLFLHFEVTPHRTVLFYIGIFTVVLTVSRSMIPEERFVFDPEQAMLDVVRFTHYLPNEWKGNLHSQKVHLEFGKLFQLKVMIFVRELASVILTPFILWFSLPDCSAAILDFFREFSIHVDGMGYVCSFAVFDFHRNGNLGPEGAATAAGPTSESTVQAQRRRNRPGAKRISSTPAYLPNDNHKMEQSILHFKATHPDWVPSDPSASVRLDRLVGANPSVAHSPTRPARHLAGSMYAGGRGLGLGLHLAKHQQNSTSQISSPGIDESRQPGARWFAHSGGASHGASHLATMREGEDEGDDDDDEEAEALGWNRRVDEADDEDEGPGDRRLLKDAGLILQQVMNR
ncbi:autophagy protein atg9 [Vanrija albida]|uniref:Autophagy-related protein 9 n=1 Tax=Vanrija albida TaxID=181172 RepID=A0ABR3Q035_9TREE